MKNQCHLFAYTFVLLISLFACNKPESKLSTGTWRGALITETGIEIPFNFNLKDSSGDYSLEIINGEEKFQVDDVVYKDDSVLIQMPLFDSEIKGVLNDNKIEGVWIKHLANTDARMKFYAKDNTPWRINENIVASKHNVTGKWATTFISLDGKDTTMAIGEFTQKESKVTGTFLTTTGDYRYLDGVVDGDKLSLSTFDGSHAFLFTAKINKDSTLSDGKFYSGISSVENFTAIKDASAKLPDAYSLTYLKDGAEKLSFSFPNLDGEKVSLSDKKFEDKVVIIQMLGSWCPNCMDESAYLSDFYKKYQNKGVEIIGLAYERTTDFEKSKVNIERLKKRFDIQYDLLVTGYTNKKDEAAKSLPMLNQVIAFPTMLILDKTGKVRKIHTGFNGPGTGKHYQEFTEEFDELINNLLEE